MSIQAKKSHMNFRTFEGGHSFSLTLAIAGLYVALVSVLKIWVAHLLYDD